MDDRKIVRDIVTGMITMDDLHGKILNVFAREIQS